MRNGGIHAVAHAKFTSEIGVCLSTGGPGATHLLTRLYDAKLDHAPVLAICGQAEATVRWANYQQELNLDRIFSDAAIFALRELISALGKEMHRWSGQVLDTVDYAGFIGKDPGAKNVFVAMGDSGQGLTQGVMGALLNTGLIVDGDHP